jgi:hypothetical protein
MSKGRDGAILNDSKVTGKRITKKPTLNLLIEYLIAKGYQIKEQLSNHKNKSLLSRQIIDKMGISKGSFFYLKKVDIILISFALNSIITP